MCATTSKQEISFLLPDNFSLIEGSSQILRFTGVFNAPLTTENTGSFKIKINNKDGVLVAEDDGSVNLTELYPNAL